MSRSRIPGDGHGVTVFRGSDRNTDVTERDALCVNSSALDFAEVIQKRYNRNKSEL